QNSELLAKALRAIRQHKKFPPHGTIGGTRRTPNSITSLAMVSNTGERRAVLHSNFFGSRRDHIGGVTPSRPIRHARPCNVPSGCLIAAMKTFAPGFRSLLSPGT